MRTRNSRREFSGDIPERKEAEDIIRNIAQGVLTSVGEEFFDSLAQCLARTLKTDCALIGELTDERKRIAKTVAVCANGKILENFEYDLTNTPCGNVVGRGLCSYPADVQKKFPLNQFLAKMNAESYIGVPLFDSKSRPLGFMGVLDRKPLKNTSLVESALQILAVHAAAELERKRSEQKIRNLQSYNRGLIEASIDPLVTFDRKGIILDVNEATVRATGRTREELIGTPFAEYFTDPERAQEGAMLVFEAGEVRDYDLTVVARDGTETIVSCNASVYRDQTGEVVGAFVAARDITERKRAIEALRESEKMHSTLVENSLTGIYIDQDGRVVFGNDRFAEIYGYSNNELLGLETWRLVHPLDRPMVDEIRMKRLKGETVPQEYEARGLTKGGETIRVLRRNTRIEYRGKPAILGNIVDVTKRRRMEEDLRHVSAQLLTAQEKERGRIARELHDEIGQSLSAIKFKVENISKQLSEGTTRAILEPLQGIVPMIQRAVEEVRRISMDLRPSTLDDLGILATIAWYCREFQATYHGIGIEKEIRIEENGVPESLKTVIYRVLQEAMNNVAKHSNADLVRIYLVKTDGTINFTIQDNGRGFDLEQERSAGNTRRGFGLASMRERTELAGGSFSIESGKGAGTIVRASWPW